MTDFFRRIVSGNKARFRDDKLDIDLDLVYITDQVIVMGYPASGIESLYRNRREDAKKFLEHRHGQNFWVFNFCPIKENSYPASVFDGRVSRYPFPDHHAPPLAILSLVAREMRVWLEQSPEHVAVLHCKAGKGRSGTMACAYLLSLDSPSSPPTLQRSNTAKVLATSRAQQLMDAMPSDAPPEDEHAEGGGASEDATSRPLTPDGGLVQAADSRPLTPADNLDHVLDLHTSRRMKRPSSPSRKATQGVSIPSQRRWLYYWSILIAHQEPPGFWSLNYDTVHQTMPKVRLLEIKLRMRELSGVQTNLVRAASALLKRTNLAKAPARRHVWASLARYDDELVGLLERWERHTRDETGKMGKRRSGSERMGSEALSDIFKGNEWDKPKMVSTFAYLGSIRSTVQKGDSAVDEKIVTRTLRPFTDGRLGGQEPMQAEQEKREGDGEADSEQSSLQDIAGTPDDADGIVLDANREVRVKLYMGQVFMGWFWLIPTFHMPHPRNPSGQSTTILLKRKELDFPIGIGSSIVDLEISMEWLPVSADAVVGK